jgi:DNA-binding LacI/PurR family transcriptional regulator
MNTLGVIMLTDQSESYEYDHSTGLSSHNIVDGIMQGLEDTDYSLITEKIYLDGEDRLPKIVRNRRIDGVFLVGGSYK